MPCKSIGKWGAFLKLVDVILEKRDIRMRALTSSSQIQNTDDARSCCKDVCKIPARKHIFHNVNRFKDIELYAYSTLCLNLMKWSNCTTKRWKCIRSQSHLVIHLPSMSYPCWLRCIDRKKFTSLQNIQIGRIGWLVNKNANVLYIYPGKSNLKMKLNLYNFIANARPDVCLSRLRIIVNDFKNLHEDINSKYPSGCESLFYTPSVYHRVSYISSGCSGFIIPGVLSKTDLFIACELKTPIIGPCLKFQERLLNKEYVMSILAEANIKHPPYSKVKNLQDLCLRMAEMMTRLPWGFHRKWLLKLNYGFCSNQSAFIQLDPAECFKRMNELPYYLAHILPQKLIFQTESHMDHSDFFDRIKEYGAVLMCCPIVDFRTVSLGFFIEHDTAKASLRTTGDVIHMHNGSNCFTNDLGFIIPQTTLPDSMLQDLANRLGDLLVAELYIGFFGVDIVVFPSYDLNDNKILNYWVVDIDPYYTDLLSFDDWRRFCLDIPEPKCPNQKAQLDISPFDSNHRYVVCSGKLYIDGLFADNSINELCTKHKIAYSYKVKTGCMIHPIDIKEQTFLLFSFYRSKELALKYFVLALKALYYTSVNDKQLIQKNEKRDIINLARDMEIYYNIVD
ncbi:PREDICTED: IQ domain-containing protein H-like [Ceratosolen solmsi marchali]|uniref:IQ domain-containing protein H-like n=1 Tax=Ceratosolen solmsi marchali TaxID=326594 RepID=A0AAJ7E015_9HYME|nr:PREDICTED: IQ domain-containing protein H-like [Ceratosolen solmsi marchali]